MRSPYMYVTDLTDGGVRSECLEDRNVSGGKYSSISVIKYLGALGHVRSLNIIDYTYIYL